MGRRYYADKRQEEIYLNKMTISFFTKRGYLKKGLSYHSGNYIWMIGEEEIGKISYQLLKDDGKGKGSIRVMFHRKDLEKDFDYDIQLVATPCHFGGLRWWFLDPCYSGYRKCAVLYLQYNGYFASGKIINIAYCTQNERRGVMKAYMEGLRAIMLHKTIKYPYRRGKPTRKMRRFIKYVLNGPSAKGYSVDDMVKSCYR